MENATTIYLYNIYKKKDIKLIHMILYGGRSKENLLTYLFYNTFKNKIKKKKVYLKQLIDFLIVSFKKKIRHKSEEKLIFWFFHHFQVLIHDELYGEPPTMFKIKKQIFMYIPYELNFPLTNFSTCLFIKQYPKLFYKIKEFKNINKEGRPDIRNLKQYCYKNKFQQEFLLLPQLSLKLKYEIFIFYKKLIKNYNYNKNFLKYKIEFNKKDQKELLTYLKNMCDFFNIKKK